MSLIVPNRPYSIHDTSTFFHVQKKKKRRKKKQLDADSDDESEHLSVFTGHTRFQDEESYLKQGITVLNVKLFFTI